MSPTMHEGQARSGRPRRGPFHFLTRWFLRGLLVVTPVAVTFYVIYTVFAWIDGLVDIDRLLGVYIPGLGVLVTIALITITGFLAGTIITRHLFDFIEGVLTRPPLVRLVYTSIRDLIEAFVGDKKRFDQPVLVRLFPDSDAKVVGFITRPSLESLGLHDHVAVYFPQSYNFAGQLLVIPKDRATPIASDSTSVMTFIVSGGVSSEGA